MHLKLPLRWICFNKRDVEKTKKKIRRVRVKFFSHKGNKPLCSLNVCTPLTLIILWSSLIKKEEKRRNDNQVDD